MDRKAVLLYFRYIHIKIDKMHLYFILHYVINFNLYKIVLALSLQWYIVFIIRIFSHLTLISFLMKT